MADANDVVYSYEGDTTGIMDSLDTISEGIQGLIEDIDALVDASSGIGEFEGIFEEIAGIFDEVDASASEAASGIDGIAEAAGSAADALSELGTAGEDLATIGDSADETSAQISGLTDTISALNDTITEDTALISDLNESITGLQAQVDMLTASEDTAEASTGGLAAMLDTLGASLKAAQGPLMLISMAGIAAGVSMYNMGSAAQNALNQVQALAGVGSAQMATYTSQLEAQGEQFGETLDQEAQGLFYVTSAGFSGAGAMSVLAQSVMDAKSGNVDLSVSSKSLTGVLNAYGASANQAGQYNDLMMKAVVDGTAPFGDFASSIGKAASEGNAAHVSFNQVAAAVSTLTDHSMTARNASQDLATMMRSMDSNFDQTATTAKSLGLNFNEAAFKSMDLQHQMGYLQDITKGNQTELGKLVGGQAGLLAFNDLMTKNADGTSRFSQVLDDMKNSSGSAAQAFATSQDTISAHWAKVQAALSVISYKALTALTPTINAVADAFGKAADFLSQHMDVMMPILAGLAAFFGVIVVSAIAALVIAIGSVVGPFLGVGAIIGAVVAGIVLAVEHWGGIVGWLRGIWSAFMGWFNGIFGGIEAKWSQLEGFFKGVWGNVASGSKTAWNNVVGAAHTAGSNIQSWWSGVVSGFEKNPLGGAIIKTLQSSFGQVGQQFGQIGQTLKTQLGGALSGVKTSLGQVGDSFKLVWQQIQPGLQLVGGALSTAWKQVSGAMTQVGQIIATSIGPFWKALQQQLAQVASIVGGALSTAWKALSPIFAQIGGGVGAQLLTTLKMIGAILGGIVLIAISLVLGAIVGLAKGFATLVQGIAMVIGGIVKVFSGVIQIASGIVAFLTDLFTGHFSKLGADLGTIWHGIVTMFSGLWDVLKGLFMIGVKSLADIVSGLVTTVIQFFTNLWDKLVGHSIIPDMINGIVNWFEQLPTRALTFVEHLVNSLTTTLGGLGAKALTWAGDMISQFVQGIENGIGAVGNAVQKIAGKISSFLHFSKPDVGPLADVDNWMPDFGNLLAKDLQDQIPKLESAARGIAQSVASVAAPNPSNLPQGPNAAASGLGSPQAMQYLAQISQGVQGMQRQQVSPPTSANLGAVTQNFGGMQFHGVQDPQSLAQALDNLMGQGFIFAQRGAIFNN